MLDAFPAARYHCLLLPKCPSVDVGDLPPDVAAGLFAELPRLVAAVKAASGAPAVKVSSNAGAEAGQVVFHTHVHVVPCFSLEDSLDGATVPVDTHEAKESLKRLRHLLA